MASRLIADVWVLDGTGREPFGGWVRGEGNRITQVSAGTPDARAGEPVIDGRGATLMPCLVQDRSAIRMIMKDGVLHQAP
jgi:cytosine/adenosine deaminase-related metal-dependent hydrolase